MLTKNHFETIEALLKLQQELAKTYQGGRLLPEPPGDLFTPAGQSAALKSDDYLHRLELADRRMSAQVAKDVPLLPPSLPGHERPVLQLTGDQSVKKEFLERLQAEGRLSRDPTREGWLVARGSLRDLAGRWTEAAAAVAAREGRPLAAMVVHSDGPRANWPGGAVFAAAKNEKELHAESTRAFVNGMPDATITKHLDKMARTPSMLVDKNGDLAKDGIRKALDYFSNPKFEKPGDRNSGRSASVGEVANMSVTVTYLAGLLDENDPVAKRLLGAVASMEASAREQLPPGAYDKVKAIVGEDLAKAQGQNLQQAAKGLQQEGLQQGLKQEGQATPAADQKAAQLAPQAAAAGRSMER